MKRWASLLLLAPLTACSLIVSLDDLRGTTDASGGDASDAGADVTGGDVASDAPDNACTLASVGLVSNATGLSSQTHVVYAQHASQWWLFYIDSADTALLKTRYSSDFCSWTDGASLTLPYPHSNEGRNFSVAYADLGGQDVVHIAFSHLVDSTHRYHTHTRAVVSGTSITYGTPIIVTQYTTTSAYPIDPDGTATTVGSDGFVVEQSGWVDEGSGHVDDAVIFRSTTADDGGSFTNAWSSFDVLGFVDNVVNARGGVALFGGNVLLLWENGSDEPDPSNVGWSMWNGSTWSSPSSVFSDNPQGMGDWSVSALSTSDVHAVRRTLAGTFDHVRFNGSSWGQGSAIASESGARDTGVFVAATGTSVGLYAVAADQSTIRSSVWNGGNWSPWSTLVGAGPSRSFVAGYASAAANKAALVWTEQGTSAYSIRGVLLQ